MSNKIDLSAHIAKLKAKEAASPRQADDALLFWGAGVDKKWLPYLKSCVGSYRVFVRLEEVTTITSISMYCHSKKVTKVISSSPSLLKKLLYWDKRKAPVHGNYAGSYFTIPGFKDSPEIEIVFINPIKHLVTVTYGRFMAKRLISKLIRPDDWYQPTEFLWSILKPENEEINFQCFSQSNIFLVSMDIETFQENATIRCLSYTGFWYDKNESNGIHSESVVLPLDSEYNLSIMRKWNWQLKAPKVFQNGKYDISYLARYNAPIYNYLYDTAHLFHSWYSELPKDLGFLNSFFIREAVYWKDLAETNDLHEYYRYNALDTWGTGNAFLAMLLEAPPWAITNYLKEFPLVFPCHMSEMRGIARDMDKLEEARAMQQEIVDRLSKELNTILDVPEGESFNVKSNPQMMSMLRMLGCKDLKSADEKNLKKARFRHPFNARIINLVLRIRKARTLISNYLTAGKEFNRLDGTGSRYLYSLNPHGTDTGRLASKSHHFWCGDNIQKIPRPDPDSGLGYSLVKTTFKADPGFLLFEVDLEQAESRDTAYISGDEAMIDVVENSPDFHCGNASAFFGIPFEELFDVATGKKLNKKIRDIAKNVNHGANYNMGYYVLIDTMTEENIVKAKHLLKLPRFWTYKQVAEYLLEKFHLAYPGIREIFYKGIIDEILTTRMLKHHVIGETGWVRYCFGNPDKNKPALNSYIAHVPQGLNAQTLNKSYLKVFHEIQMNKKHAPNFKLMAQIHDSIFGQYRIGHRYLTEMVRDMMEIPVTIRGYDKKIRTFTVPASVKAGTDKSNNIATYWSETE